MTTRLFEALAEVATTLDGLDVDWALVGGLALSAYVEPRFTRDIDIAVSVDEDEKAEEMVRAWTASGYRIHAVVEQEVADRVATVRSHRPGDEYGIVVDLLFASSGIEAEIANEARSLDLASDLMVPVARPGHLFALKLLSVDPDKRPQDAIDLENLVQVLDDEERRAAWRAIELIEQRGYGRDRDLEALWEQYIAE